MSAPNQPPEYNVLINRGGNTASSWYRWFQSLGGGLSTTVKLAKLTTGGQPGTMTFVNGILTAYKAPT